MKYYISAQQTSTLLFYRGRFWPLDRFWFQSYDLALANAMLIDVMQVEALTGSWWLGLPFTLLPFTIRTFLSSLWPKDTRDTWIMLNPKPWQVYLMFSLKQNCLGSPAKASPDTDLQTWEMLVVVRHPVLRWLIIQHYCGNSWLMHGIDKTSFTKSACSVDLNK